MFKYCMFFVIFPKSSFSIFRLVKFLDVNLVLFVDLSNMLLDLQLVVWPSRLNFDKFSLEIFPINEYFGLDMSLFKYLPFIVDFVPTLSLILLSSASTNSFFNESV